MLESPHFLYLVEGPGPLTPAPAGGPACPTSCGTRPPDAKLSVAGRHWRIADARVLRNEAKRMLSDPRAQQMIDDFHTRWLGVEKLPILSKEPTGYPEFEALKPAMQRGDAALRQLRDGRGGRQAGDAADRALHLRQRAAGQDVRRQMYGQ
jgi:hypothetical protein